jgi:hypothetical protein
VNCDFCNCDIESKNVRVVGKPTKYLHLACYESMWKSFLILAGKVIMLEKRTEYSGTEEKK